MFFISMNEGHICPKTLRTKNQAALTILLFLKKKLMSSLPRILIPHLLNGTSLFFYLFMKCQAIRGLKWVEFTVWEANVEKLWSPPETFRPLRINENRFKFLEKEINLRNNLWGILISINVHCQRHNIGKFSSRRFEEVMTRQQSDQTQVC